VTTTTGTTGSSSTTVPAPAGVTVSIQSATTMSDASGAPVTGTIATSVAHSATAADLPAAARTLPAGTTLVNFIELDMGAVKTFSRPLNVAVNVVSAGAAVNEALVVYAFNATSNQWVFGGTEVVGADGTVTPDIDHLSVWGIFKTATPPPAKPSGISVTGGDGQAVVSWTAPVTGATSYNIYYATTAGVTTTNGTKLAGATSPQTVTGLTNGTTYYFVVTAVNANGESIVSSEKSGTPAAAPQAPGSPTGVSVTSTTAGQATVAWSAVTGATSYNVYYSTSSALTVGAGTNGTKVSSTSSPLDVTGLTSGTKYYFLVTAANAAGESGAQTNTKSVVVQ
jgi:hypothetical protein